MRLIRWAGGRARTVWVIALVGGLGLGVLGAGFASRRPVHHLSFTLGASQFPGYPVVAADGSLGFDAVWADRAIMTAHWSASTREWSKAVALRGWVPGQWEPQIAGSPSGAGAILWTQGRSSSPQEVEASYRPAGAATWPTPARLFSARPEAGVSEIAQVGMDAQGDAFAAWATSRKLYVAEHPAGASSWAAPVALAHAGLEAFAVSSNGTAVAVWEQHLGGGISSASRDRLYVSVKPPGQTSWLPRLDLGPSGYYPLQGDAWIFLPHPRVAINARGTAFVVWQSPQRNQFYPRVAILTAAGGWRKPRYVTLTTPGVDPAIAADDRGSSTVLWETGGVQGGTGISEANLTPRGRVLATRALGFGGDARVTSDGKGDLAAVWSAAALRPAGQQTCPRVHLKAEEDDWSIAIAPDGVAQILWEHSRSGNRGDVILARTLRPCRAG